jgi:hypothetical protein
MAKIGTDRKHEMEERQKIIQMDRVEHSIKRQTNFSIKVFD